MIARHASGIQPLSRASLGAAMLILSGALSATFANDYSMARGDKLQWSPDGAGQFRPMELDPHDPTGNPWLFGEQFHEPQKTALPWVQHPASSRDVIERYEPRPWGEQGRRDRYRGDADRERLRRLQEAPARPYRADGRQTHAQGFDLVPRPVSHQRPLSASADYSVEPSPAVQRGGEDAEVWGSSRRPW